jgi:hypothetical protein
MLCFQPGPSNPPDISPCGENPYDSERSTSDPRHLDEGERELGARYMCSENGTWMVVGGYEGRRTIAG